MTKTLLPKPCCQGIIIKLSTDYTLKPREYIIVYTAVNIDCKNSPHFCVFKARAVKQNISSLHDLEKKADCFAVYCKCLSYSQRVYVFDMYKQLLWNILDFVKRQVTETEDMKIELPYSSISGVLVRSG